MNSITRFAAASFASLALLAGVDAVAQVPTTLTQQGLLHDASGEPLSGTYTFTYALYSAESSASPIWTETQIVPVEDGHFVAVLGVITPLTNVFTGAELFLGMSIDGDPEVVPRERITSVPYALVAGDVSGDIHPNSVSVNGVTVIDDTGSWVGDASGLIGPRGEQGPQGDPGLTPEISPRHFVAECEGLGVSIGWEGSWVNICDGAQGPEGPQGEPGTFEVAGPFDAVFGVGPLTLVTGTGWVIEALDEVTLQVRQTGTRALWVNIEYPSGCVGTNIDGGSTTYQAHRITLSLGDTLDATLCTEGSMATVTVYNGTTSTYNRVECMRSGSNSIRCHQIF